MKVQEIQTINPTLENIKKAGESVFSNNTENKQTAKHLLQYPAQRSQANDSGNGYQISNLYQNGLLFTAHNFNDRATRQLNTFRESNRKKVIGSTGVMNNTAATILMPRSLSEADQISHKLGDVKDSQFGKGGSAGGMISNMVSEQIWKAIDGAIGGALFSDNNEQLYTATRSTYQGADKRTKVFSWHLVPQNTDDLKQIYAIYKTFQTLSYGSVGRSDNIDDITSKLHKEYVRAIGGDEAANTISVDDTALGSIASFLTNVNVVSNPTLWMVKNFYANDSEAKLDLDDVFGPAQIQSIRFDKTPDGHFNGLSKYPNISGSYHLEITMKEIIALSRDNFGGAL